MNKIEVLFVVEMFYRAGAERFAYEIDSALDKSKFKLTILCLEEKESISPNWKERYYESRHEALGTKISFIDPFLEKRTTSRWERIFHKLTRRKFKRQKNKFNSSLYSYLNEFEVIHWMGEYTFIHSVPENIKKKSLIYSMSAKFQNAHLYDSYEFDYPYHFISGFKLEEGEYSQFKNIKHTFFPLLMKIPVKEKKWNFNEKAIKKIGIFTRLNRNKPLDPFFYAFQLLLDKMSNVELHVFGNGDPKTEGIINYLERLGITEKVFFRGHQDDILETTINENIDLSWFQGYNNDRPAGYAGFDICTTGTPLVCWDFFAKPFNPYNEIYPHFKNLNDFVDFSIEILNDKEKAESLSMSQFTDVLETRNIDKYISVLENLYTSSSIK